MTFNGYAELHPLDLRVRADNLETVYGYSTEQFPRELAHGIDSIDTDDADSMRWAMVLMDRRIAELEG